MSEPDKTKDLVKLFLRDKPAFILKRISNCPANCYASIVAKEVDCTYSHTVRILQVLEKNKLLIFKKDGRIKGIELTKKGKKIAETIKKLISYIHEE